MPELPEVETIRMGLQKYLVGKKVEKVELRLPKILKEGNLQDLVGAEIKSIRRFGKVLVVDFVHHLSMVVHIKLTGQFIYVGKDRPKEVRISSRMVGVLPGKFTHIIVYFEGGSKLFFNDIRQFGWVRVMPTSQVEEFKFINELGPEPPLRSVSSAGQAPLTLKHFRDLLANKGTKIKALLLDQSRISGVGNIYANDSLFLAGIDPRRPARSLNTSEQYKLYEALLEVLRRGLKCGGASELTYVNALGGEGSYQNHFLVYAQNGKPCKKCGTKIEKVVLGGRGTYFCPACQK